MIQKTNTIGKAIAVLEAIQTANHALSVKELAEHLKINKSSLHHHLKTLTELGFLQRNTETKKYDIGMNLVRIGQAYLQRLNVRERGHHLLENLSKNLSETVHMMIIEQHEVVYIDKVDVNHQPGDLKCTSYIGLRTDPYSTAAGKVLLSHLERGSLQEIVNSLTIKQITPFTITNKKELIEELKKTKERGYGLDLQEHALGLQCIAVPVLNQHSQCIAAVSVSCPVAVINREILESEILTHLRETGFKISQAMGYTP